MSVKIKINPRNWFNFNPNRWKRKLKAGIKSSFRTRVRGLGTALTALSTLFLTILSANPGYSIQMLSSGLRFWPIAFMTRLTGLTMNSGYTGLALTIIFSGLVGVTMTNTVIQLRMSKIDVSSLGAVPGFLAGGCASCGVGVLSILGFGGVLASLPYQGNFLRLAGVILIVTLIIRTGNPETCKI